MTAFLDTFARARVFCREWPPCISGTTSSSTSTATGSSAAASAAARPKAFNLLVLMVQRPGHLFTKQEIFDTLWAGTAVTTTP